LGRKKSFKIHIPGWPWEDLSWQEERAPGWNEHLTAPMNHDKYRKRSSLASSALVTGMRTATASVESSSLVPGSRKNTILSDQPTSKRNSYLSNEVRRSGDSGRPMTINSIDDAAWTRAVKRRQVIQEIVSSEESYVADMKVLVNVWHTAGISQSLGPLTPCCRYISHFLPLPLRYPIELNLRFSTTSWRFFIHMKNW
jgi:hypothetical protein